MLVSFRLNRGESSDSCSDWLGHQISHHRSCTSEHPVQGYWQHARAHYNVIIGEAILPSRFPSFPFLSFPTFSLLFPPFTSPISSLCPDIGGVLKAPPPSRGSMELSFQMHCDVFCGKSTTFTVPVQNTRTHTDLYSLERMLKVTQTDTTLVYML